MQSSRLVTALATVLLGCGILFSAAFARDVSPPASATSRAESRTAQRPIRLRPSEGAVVARVSVARLEGDWPVFEGIGAATLARGAGHVPSTALPGNEERGGASVIAISRGRLGEAIGRLRLGDRVRLVTPFGERGYRVAQRRVHEPSRFRVDSVPESRVTLLAPFPPDSPGPAPMRLAVVLEPSN